MSPNQLKELTDYVKDVLREMGVPEAHIASYFAVPYSMFGNKTIPEYLELRGEDGLDYIIGSLMRMIR